MPLVICEEFTVLNKAVDTLTSRLRLTAIIVRTLSYCSARSSLSVERTTIEVLNGAYNSTVTAAAVITFGESEIIVLSLKTITTRQSSP